MDNFTTMTDLEITRMTVGGQAAQDAPRPDRGGRRRGSSNTHSRQHTGLAQAFERAGLDWRLEMAEAIKARNYKRMQYWLKLLPYLLTGDRKPGMTQGGILHRGRVSRAAIQALRDLEGRKA